MTSLPVSVIEVKTINASRNGLIESNKVSFQVKCILMTFKTEKDFLVLEKANIRLVSGYQFL